jgi:hypothetical protein
MNEKFRQSLAKAVAAIGGIYPDSAAVDGTNNVIAQATQDENNQSQLLSKKINDKETLEQVIIEYIEQSFKSIEEKIEERLEKFEKNISQIEEGIEKRIEHLEERFEKIFQQFNDFMGQYYRNSSSNESGWKEWEKEKNLRRKERKEDEERNDKENKINIKKERRFYTMIALIVAVIGVIGAASIVIFDVELRSIGAIFRANNWW